MALNDLLRNLLSDKEDTAKKPSNGQHPQTEEQGRALADNPKAWLNDYKAALTPGESVEPAPLRGSLVDKAVTLALDSEPARVKRAVNAIEGDEKLKEEPSIGIGTARTYEEWKTAAYTPREQRDYAHIESIVGIAPARAYQQIGEKGDIRTYEHYKEGGKVHLDSSGQFYTQEGKPIDRNEASNLQRLTAHEWKPTGVDNVGGELTRTIHAASEESIGSYLKENRLGNVSQASPEQRGELIERIQERSGLSYDNARFTVLDSVMRENRFLNTSLSPEDFEKHHTIEDTLKGKAGLALSREWNDQNQAHSLTRPYIQNFVAENRLPGAQAIPEEQKEKIAGEVSRTYNLNPKVASEVVKEATDERSINSRRDILLLQAVGPENREHYTYKSSSGDIDSFQNKSTGIHVHIDQKGNFYNQARELVNASAALSYAEQQHVIAPANRVQSRESLLPLPADSPAAVQQTVKVQEPVAKIAAEYAPSQALSF